MCCQLKEMKDTGLYKNLGFEDFDGYVEKAANIKKRQAYSYITYKKDKMLSEVADKRLKAIKEFTEFGSGFKIAMRDLEIRGAGSLLRRNSIRTPRASRI